MHQLSDSRCKALIFTCYMDDSGTDNQTAIALIGGSVFDRVGFLRLDTRWKKMLVEHRIESLHMQDFVRPYGKHVGMFKEMKIALFRQAVKIVTQLRQYSISVAVDSSEHKDCFPEDVRKVLGSYAIAFNMAAQLNGRICDDNRCPDQIAYMLDAGNSQSQQIMIGHTLLVLREKAAGGPYRTGTLTFQPDDQNAALQAADMVAWTARRNFSGEDLRDEFEPLLRLFQKRFDKNGLKIRPHVHHLVPRSLLVSMSEEATNNQEGLGREIAALVKAATAGG